MIFKPGDYVKYDGNDKTTNVSENQSMYTLSNPDGHHVVKYLLDKGIIPSGDNSIKKCDWIIEINRKSDNNKFSIYCIELKDDRHLEDSYLQLESTIRLLFDTDYRSKCNPFAKAFNPDGFKNIKGKMIQLRVVVPNPSTAKKDSVKHSRTHGGETTKQKMLRITCVTYGIKYDLDQIVRKTRTSETV